MNLLMRASLLALAKSIYYVPDGYVLPEKVWFLWCFSLKTGTDFAHFGLETMLLRELKE